MLLGYKPSIGGQDAYHYGKAGGADRKFIRVVAGAALPIFDRMLGAVVVVAETYRPSGPASWVALEAAAGEWPAVENAMAQFRMDLKFTHVIVEREEARTVIWGMKGLNYGINEIPLVSYAAPFYAGSEVGRAYVDQLLKEGRLVLPDYVQGQIEMEPQAGTLALHCVMCFLKENLAYYSPLRKQGKREPAQILGLQGLE